MKRYQPTQLALAALLTLGACHTPGGHTDDAKRAQADLRSPVTDVPSGAAHVDPAESVRVNTELAAAYLQAGKLRTAGDVIKNALAIAPEDIDALTVQALIHAAANDDDAATIVFLQALRIAPSNPDLNHNYAVFVCQHGHAAESIKYFDRALANKLYEHKANSLAGKARCFLLNKDAVKAREAFIASLTAEPGHAGALYGLAQLEFSSGRLDVARELLHRLHETGAYSPQSLFMLIRTSEALGNNVEKRAAEDALQRYFPQSEEAKIIDVER